MAKTVVCTNPILDVDEANPTGLLDREKCWCKIFSKPNSLLGGDFHRCQKARRDGCLTCHWHRQHETRAVESQEGVGPGAVDATPHTPGRWEVSRTDEDIESSVGVTVYIGDDDGAGRFAAVRGVDLDEDAANARLIAAAPDLLEMAWAFIDRTASSTRPDEARIQELAYAAIASATGLDRDEIAPTVGEQPDIPRRRVAFGGSE